MKISSLTCFTVLTLVAGICEAQQPSPANYVGLRMGRSNNNIASVDAINPRVSGITSTSIEKSSLASLALGRRYGSNWRGEIEYTDRSNANVIVNTLGAGFSGRNELKAKSWSLMANGYYDIPVSDRFLMFGQLGLGYARTSLNGTQNFQAPADTGAFAFGTSFPGADKNNIAVSFGAGGQFKVTQQFGLDFGLRRVNLGKMETRNDTVNGDEKFRARLSSNELYGGLSFSF